jgi:type I restriction enzyme R subunit
LILPLGGAWPSATSGSSKGAATTSCCSIAAVGSVARKKADVKLPAAAKRSDRQAEELPHYLAQLFPVGIAKLPFHYETTGTEIYFRDEREARPRLRLVSDFHRPETLARRLEEPPADNQ